MHTHIEQPSWSSGYQKWVTARAAYLPPKETKVNTTRKKYNICIETVMIAFPLIRNPPTIWAWLLSFVIVRFVSYILWLWIPICSGFQTPHAHSKVWAHLSWPTLQSSRVIDAHGLSRTASINSLAMSKWGVLLNVRYLSSVTPSGVLEQRHTASYMISNMGSNVTELPGNTQLYMLCLNFIWNDLEAYHSVQASVAPIWSPVNPFQTKLWILCINSKTDSGRAARVMDDWRIERSISLQTHLVLHLH